MIRAGSSGVLFSSDRKFVVGGYGMGHSQLTLRSYPTDDLKCLDVTFESVVWLSVPTRLDSIRILRAVEGHPALPPGAEGLATRYTPLTLLIETTGVTGSVICARAIAALTNWQPQTEIHYEGLEHDVIWSLVRERPTRPD